MKRRARHQKLHNIAGQNRNVLQSARAAGPRRKIKRTRPIVRIAGCDVALGNQRASDQEIPTVSPADVSAHPNRARYVYRAIDRAGPSNVGRTTGRPAIVVLGVDHHIARQPIIAGESRWRGGALEPERHQRGKRNRAASSGLRDKESIAGP